MTYSKCLCNGEYAEIISYDNALSNLSDNPDIQDFGQYECKVMMFIRQQIKSRENKFLCNQSEKILMNDNVNLLNSECNLTTNSMRGIKSKALFYRLSIVIVLIIAMILRMTGDGEIKFCIPVSLNQISQSKFF
ncbi:PREDICTED: uncharacterized protein LOC105367612 [Ceratosolen solmsi marchali]|uniref:Uncharacterized protein LOC105367612 n=1 Tax=Ceratosolen solmsi marchali TaxID=326594 RepID=A0AAJ6YUN4_9HYME|nr:PREDICTED: uncharacterized protein LOC105367612 [Ceratosolen solmsi marchali]